MTREELEEIKALCDAATPGPWEVQSDGWTIRSVVGETEEEKGAKVAATIYGSGSIAQQVDDALFIAASRQYIPALVGEVERLTAELEAVRLVLQQLAPHHPEAQAILGTLPAQEIPLGNE